MLFIYVVSILLVPLNFFFQGGVSILFVSLNPFISILFTVWTSKAYCGPELDWEKKNGCPPPLTTFCTELNQWLTVYLRKEYTSTEIYSFLKVFLNKMHLFQYNFYLNMMGSQSHLARSKGLKQIEHVLNMIFQLLCLEYLSFIYNWKVDRTWYVTFLN